MSAHFWTTENEVHECWRMAEGETVRSYQLIGECRRDLEEGGFKAARYRLPAIFPERRHFGSVKDAQEWIVGVLN